MGGARAVRRLALPLAVAGALAAPAAQAAYAPLDHPGAPLSVPRAKLDASLACGGPSLAGARRAPVLLVPGTGATPKENWSWTYEPPLTAKHIPWCAVTLPQYATGDIQVAGEYVVNAIRTMYRRSGRRIAIIGHSQGGMVPRWPLRFWPDTRAMVDDVIGFAATNHGTTQVQKVGVCKHGCTPADWQQAAGSMFIRALNSYTETFAGISYTEVYTHTDESVQPNNDDRGSSSLHGGGGQISNVAVQDICPLDVSVHIVLGTIDPVAYALAFDALDHPGPADPARISRTVCGEVLQPGIDKGTVVQDGLAALFSFETAPNAAHVAREPALKCYVTAGCPAAPRARLRLTVSPRRVRAGRSVRFRFRVRLVRAGRARAVRGAVVRFAGGRARTNRRGLATLRTRFRHAGRYSATARLRGAASARVRVRVLAAARR